MNRSERKITELLENNDINTPPVPVGQIAIQLGVKLVFKPFEGKDDISGMFFRDGQTKIIGINSAHSHTRQRFSIAHEIGHLILHNKDIFVDKAVRINFRDKRSSLAVDQEEIAANAFAAQLLMPKDFIQTEINKLLKRKAVLHKDELIDNLAKIFDVSPQAMEYRLINLGIVIGQ